MAWGRRLTPCACSGGLQDLPGRKPSASGRHSSSTSRRSGVDDRILVLPCDTQKSETRWMIAVNIARYGFRITAALQLHVQALQGGRQKLSPPLQQQPETARHAHHAHFNVGWGPADLLPVGCLLSGHCAPAAPWIIARGSWNVFRATMLYRSRQECNTDHGRSADAVMVRGDFVTAQQAEKRIWQPSRRFRTPSSSSS